MIARIRIFSAFAILGAAASEAQTPATTVVNLQAITFVPRDVTIRVGDTVRWVWVTGFHNVESGTVDAQGDGVPDGRFRSGNPTLGAGTTFEVLFDQAFLSAHPADNRAYPYYCIVHVGIGMVGTVTVVGCITDGDCADNDPCTNDLCNAGTCQHPVNACDDGDVCTGTDVCSNGICAGTPIPNCCRSSADCNDGQPCTDDFCDAERCRASPASGRACNDGDPCTTGDICFQGVCRGAPMAICCRADAECDDGNDCTDDRCRGGACEHLPNTQPCDDGDPCTDGDACESGVCSGETIVDCCHSAQDCPTQPCVTMRCADNACLGDAVDECVPCITPADCDDADECTDERCMDGVCSNAFNTAECDDTDPCTEDDRCHMGACEGTPLEGCCMVNAQCADDDPCTDDECSEGRCLFTPILNCDSPVTDNGDSETDHADDHPPEEPEDPAVRPTPQPRVCGALGFVGMFCLTLTALRSKAYRRGSRGSHG